MSTRKATSRTPEPHPNARWIRDSIRSDPALLGIDPDTMLRVIDSSLRIGLIEPVDLCCDAATPAVQEAIYDLEAAARAYGDAADALRYPALNRLVKDLKEASRRYRWRFNGIYDDPRPNKKRAANHG